MPSSRRAHVLELCYCKSSQRSSFHRYRGRMPRGVRTVHVHVHRNNTGRNEHGVAERTVYTLYLSVENARNHAVGSAYALCDDIPVGSCATSPACLIGRWSPPVALPHIFPSFAGIAKSRPLFLSFCVSVSRHLEGPPDTLSGGREVSKGHGIIEEK
jgi:hypothetical protein